MNENTTGKHTIFRSKGSDAANDSEARPRRRALLLLDLALLVTVVLMTLTDQVVLYFHIVFILLTLGAFYWRLRGFALRAGLWVTVTTVVVLSVIAAGGTQVEELGEIPLLTLILLLVFGIAKQRAKAEEALRKANEELEIRVAERTAELVREIAMHQQTEETLRESEERYRRLVELSFEAVVIHRKGKLVDVNPAAARLFGVVSSEELIGKPLRDFVHPYQWSAVETRVQQVEEEGIGVPLTEEKLIRTDGTSVDVEVAAIPITHQGRPAVLTVIHDIAARKQAETEREDERARIARNLHDSLGHSLGYLHLKLDQLVDGDDLGEAAGVRQDLAQMRDVANEAYEVVRSLLAALRPSNSADLATALLVQARAVGQRGELEVHVSSKGQPTQLAPVVQQQVLYLFHEALANAERHANAQHVDIHLSWAEDALTLVLVDDGCGFEVDAQRSNGHYGLRIMQERAEEINGRFTINSQPGVGTEVILRLPLTPDLQGVADQ